MNITETAGVDHSISAVAMMSQRAGADYSLMAKNISKMADEDISTNASNGVKNAKEGINIATEGTINKHAQGELQNNSGEKSKQF